MILEFEKSSTIMEDDLLKNVREPDHEEAIKALLSGNRELFTQLLVSNNMGIFRLSPHKVVAANLDLQEGILDIEFDKMLKAKLSEVLMASEEGGRLFVTPSQISLHNYTKQQYFDDKYKPIADQNIINAYKYIFKRISHIDDLIYFIDFVTHLYIRDPFDFVQATCREALTQPPSENNNLEILKLLSNGNEEDKLIIQLCFSVAVSYLSKKSKQNVMENVVEEIRGALQAKPLRKLSNACLFLDPFTFIDNIVVFEKHPRELVQYDFKNNECRINCQYLHPELRGHETFSHYFKKLKNLEQLIQKYELIAHSARVEDNKVLLGINYDLLSYENDNGLEYSLKVSSKTISEYIDFLNLLVNHFSFDFVAIKQEKSNTKHYSIMYTCKAFELFVDLGKLKSGKSEPYAMESVLMSWARLFMKWMEIPEVKDQKYFENALKAYFYLFQGIEREEEVPNLANFESQLSKLLFQLLSKLQKYPCQTSCFMGIKTIIFRWALQMIPETKQLKAIIGKMITCYFSDELTLKLYWKEEVFEAPAMCKVVKKLVCSQIMEHISKRYERIESEKITSSIHPAAKHHSQFFPKLGYIISSKIMGEAIEAFSFIVMKSYLNYAHVWPVLNSYRMWLLQMYKDSIDTKYDQKIKVIKELASKLFAQILAQTENAMNGWSNLSKHTVELYNQFQYAANIHINCLRLKKNKDIISKETYSKYFQFLLEYEEMLTRFKTIPTEQHSSIHQWLRYGFSIQKGINTIAQEFKMTIRFSLCNSLRFLHIQEEESILNCIGNQICKIVQSQPIKGDFRWKFICDIFGVNELAHRTLLNYVQKMGPIQRYTAKLSKKLQDYIPFNFIAALYSSIRPKYKTILKYLFNSLVADQNQEELWLILQKLVFPAALISGSCIFNGQVHEKTKEDMVLGLYYDQFQKITEILTDVSSNNQNIKVIVLLEKKKKMFSKFYDILKSKNAKIAQRPKPNPSQNRYRPRHMPVEEVMQALAQMGVSREQGEIALENIEYPDQNLAIDWIDNNQQRLEEILVARTLERTRYQGVRIQSRREPEVAQNQIVPLSYDRFYEKERLIKQSRNWIKIIFKELFKEQNFKESETLKDILFMFMDSLKPETIQNQYNNLNEKLFQDLDKLDKQQNISNKLVLLLSILEGSFTKTDKVKVDFYGEKVNLKILSYLPQMTTQDAIIKTFSLLNTTLPVLKSSDPINAELQNYLAYLLDTVLQYRNGHKSQSEIMLKIAKTGKEMLMQRITRNLTIFFKEKLIKQNVFSLVNMIVESDKELSNVNAELDFKTFLYERYKHRIASFHPDKEHVLEIDIKEFSTSFPKYDKGSAIYEVSKQMLSKKKNKSKLFFYDCRKEKNRFDFSLFGKCTFITYPIKEHFKTMIKSMLMTLYEAQDSQTQEQMLTDLYKLLYNYRILIPFAIHEQIQNQNIIDWLLYSPNHCRRKYKFLAFLTLNVNLFIRNQGYSFISLSDYVCARIIKSIVTSKKDIVWSSFAALYLSQVRKFSEYSNTSFSKENQISLVSFYENNLSSVGPLEYMNISQFLYIQCKRRVIDNLRKKYKFVSSQNEPFFDRQFLNISPFFNSIPIKKNQRVEKTYSEMIDIMPGEMDEDDEESQSMMRFQQERHRLFHRRQNNRDAQVEQLIVPLPPPQQKENKDIEAQVKESNQKIEPLVLNNCEFLDVVIDLFEKYLSFEEEVMSKFDVKDIFLPKNAIIIPNLNLDFKVKVEEVPLDIDLKVKKLGGFQKRIAEIYSMLCPERQWEAVKKEVSQENQAYVNLGRRLIESLSNPLMDNNRDTLMTLERLIHGRYNREEVANNPPPRTINTNDIYQHLVEFIDPIVPVVQQLPEQPKVEPEPMVIQQPLVQNNQVPKASQSLPLEVPPPIQAEQVNQEINIPNIQLLDEEHPIQNDEVQIEEIPPLQEQEIIIPIGDPPLQMILGQGIQLQIPLIQSAINQSENLPGGQIEINVHSRSLPNIPNEPNPINPIPVSIVENNPPGREREILRMLGLPQTFLHDVGLDQQFFDSLPQDLQQEQLMHFMAQQGANLNLNRRPSNSNRPNQPLDQQSENIAFLESLDPQTRAQVLMEATPQFLISLPANIREEAERYRHLQINRMIEEQQIQEERNYGAPQKNKSPVVYPKIFKEEFSRINQDTARQIFKGVFNIYPKLKLSAIKILLQNKHTQEKAIASIIALIYSFEGQLDQTRKWPIRKAEIVSKQYKFTEFLRWPNEQMAHIRTSLLHTILEHVKVPLYKDEDFLSQKIKTDLYLEQLSEYIKDKEFFDPIIQLSSFALSYYPDLATELLKKAKDLPDELFKKITQGIRKQQWPQELYDSLSNFSQNERLKQIFAREFESKPPKIEILGKLLKFKFAHLTSLKKIHQDALEYYSTSHLQFLNQIFSIYTLQTLTEIQPLLLKHKQIHFEVIKHLYQMGKELEKEPIGIILKKPHLLDFETKKFIFRNHPKLRRQNGRRVHIEVDRTHLFQGSYHQLMSRTVRELQGKIQVSFINEPGYDAGGLKREWFLVVSREIFNQDYALFQKSSSGSTYQPNPKSYINPDHLNYFKFIGRFIGKALVDRELIDAYFTRAFYKMILGQELQFRDLQAQDYQFYKSMQWLKNNKIDENMFTFSYIYDNFGNKIEKELLPGGKDIIVNEENKMEYIEKYCMSKMRDDFSTQINKFLEGFYQIIPQECISYFEAKELQLLISGVPQVEIEDLKRNTDYSGYNPTDQIILWFWEVVSEYTQEELAKLVQFITGTSKIPVEGFSHMIGMNGIQRISIHRDPCDHQLPKSHTCFNQLDLPNYPTKDILKQKLFICLAWGSEGFGFM